MEAYCKITNEHGVLFRLPDKLTASNCYVIILHSGECILIDPHSFSLVFHLLQKCNLRPSIIFLTHGHCDHIGGLNKLRETWPVTVICSDACSREIQSDRDNMSRMMELYLYYKSGEKKLIPYEPFRCRAADLHVSDTLVLPVGDSWFRMKALPGHTHGSSVIFWNELLFSGDYLIPGEQVITRLPGGSTEEYERIARPWLQGIPDGTKIFPGHGKPFVMNKEVKRAYGL